MLLTVFGEVCPNPDQRFGADLSAMAASPCSITMVRKQFKCRFLVLCNPNRIQHASQVIESRLGASVL